MRSKRKSYIRRRPTRKIRRKYNKSKHILKKYRKSKRNTRKKRGGLVNDEEQIVEYIYTENIYGMDTFISRGNLNVNTVIYKIVNLKGRSLLYIAVGEGKKKMIKYLLEHGADPNKPTVTNGFTPLFNTILTKQHKITNILLNGGADPNIKNNKGVSPLHHAVKSNDVKIVKTLLNSPLIDVNIKMTDTNVTPLSIAIRNENRTIVRLLINAGANEPKLYKLTGEEVGLLMGEIEQMYPQGHEKYTNTINLKYFKKYITNYITKKGVELGNFRTYNIDDEHPDDLYYYLKDKVEGYFKGYGFP